MCILSPTLRARRLFKECCYELTERGFYEQEMKRALGTVVIECSNFFTADFRPICTEQGLVYVISQYGSVDVILIRDDDYSDLELPKWCSSDLLPLGFRKAAALTQILHADNIKRFGIDENDDKKAYIPNEPYHAYLKSTGQTMPLDEFALMCVSKITNNHIFEVVASILGYALLFTIAGVLMAIYIGGDLRGYMYGGALLGVAYSLIGLFYNRVVDKK